MANDAHTRADEWHKTYKLYLNLNQRLDQARPKERDALERAVAAQQEKLLAMEAPSFLALLHKLEILWEGELEGADQASEEKRGIFADLSNLLHEGGALFSHTWHHLSPRAT